jgi:orotidine-5'-phosphate decarboxylase
LSTLKTFIQQTKNSVGIFKIGLEQYTRFGTAILDLVKTADRKIFLDLKFHDIPNTVAKAVEAACSYDVDYLTIHTQGGTAMMLAAAQAAKKAAKPPKILGVTVLTSIDEQALNNELNVAGTVTKQVKHLAQLAVSSTLDGIVCSAADLSQVRSTLPRSFDIITPGIRLPDGDIGDQKRIATPQSAIADGATVLVIGRPITGAQNPGKAAELFMSLISEAIITNP